MACVCTGGLPDQSAELRKLPASVIQQAIQALAAVAASRKLGIAIPADAGESFSLSICCSLLLEICLDVVQ